MGRVTREGFTCVSNEKKKCEKCDGGESDEDAGVEGSDFRVSHGSAPVAVGLKATKNPPVRAGGD